MQAAQAEGATRHSMITSPQVQIIGMSKQLLLVKTPEANTSDQPLIITGVGRASAHPNAIPSAVCRAIGLRS